MRKIQSLLAASALTAFVLVGCGDSTPPAAPPTTTTTTVEPPPSETAASGTEEEHGHAHGTGPHDGTVADWGGGKYHVEFTVNHDKKEATVYVLGEDGKTAAPVKTKDGQIHLSIAQPEIEADLKAVPQEGDPEGAASRFVGTHDNLGVVQEYAGTISGEVDGTPYTGDFKEEPHGHEDKKPE